MKAVVIRQLRSAPEVAEVPTPAVSDGEVLVRIRAAGLNPFDRKVINGALEGFVDHHFPLVLGSDGAGIVEAVGSGVSHFQVGDRVFGQFLDVGRGRGSFAEQAVVAAERKLAHLPDELDFSIGAALPTASLTAYQALDATEVGKGGLLLVNGASGGVGQSVVQLAAQRGVRVLATGKDDVDAYLRELGADEVIDYTTQPVVDAVRRHALDGVDAVIDLVSTSGEQTSAIASVLRSAGVLVSTNGAADVESLQTRGVRGINFQTKTTPEALGTLATLAAAGTLRIRIDETVALADAPAAIERAQHGQARGKTVFIP